MRFSAFTVIAGLALGGLIQRTVLAETPEKKLVEEARRIESDVKETHYQHTTHVDKAQGVYDLDCSGFLCLILKDVLPKHYEAVPASKTHARPLALQFYDFFTAAGEKGNNGWKEILHFKNAHPGDVIVWRLKEQIKGKDTGHVMIIDEAPVEEGPNLYRVVVMDSCISPHGKDTRKEGANGVGRGTMWFVTDDAGHATGYHWKLKTGKVHDMQIVVGRAIEMETPTN